MRINTGRIVAAVVTAVALGAMADGETGIPAGAPEDYPELISWFGYSRSEPIWSGYLFVEGRYIDAPYVVEQRGREIYVNGHRVYAMLQDSKLFLTPYDAPLHEEPPPPKVPEDVMNYREIVQYPDVLRLYQYWRTQKLSAREFHRRHIQFLESLAVSPIF